MKSITRSLAIFENPFLKMANDFEDHFSSFFKVTNDFFIHYIIVRAFQYKVPLTVKVAMVTYVLYKKTYLEIHSSRE